MQHTPQNLISSAILTTCDLETINQSTVRRGVNRIIFDSENGIKLIQLSKPLFLRKLFKLTIDQSKIFSWPFYLHSLIGIHEKPFCGYSSESLIFQELCRGARGRNDAQWMKRNPLESRVRYEKKGRN